MDERLQSHYESLQRVIRFTRQADVKAAPAIALQIALVGALATRLDKLLPAVIQGPWCLERVLTCRGTGCLHNLLGYRDRRCWLGVLSENPEIRGILDLF